MSAIEPWESGLQLARAVRGCLIDFAIDVDAEKFDVEAVLTRLGVQVEHGDLGDPRVDGACFVDVEGRALALLNPGGRLARTQVGRRSTLAHELCHLLFDSRGRSVLGQADVRGATESLIEKRANAFAAELLLPRGRVFARSRSRAVARQDLRELARSAGVGIELAEHQARNQGLQVI